MGTEGTVFCLLGIEHEPEHGRSPLQGRRETFVAIRQLLRESVQIGAAREGAKAACQCRGRA